MKKTFLIAAAMVATLSPMAAQAQTRELDRGRQEIRNEQRDLRDARRYGGRDDVRDARKDLREAKREHREDWQDYRRDHRQAFKGSRFSAPFKYRSFNNGARLTATYYQPRYYVNNYTAYRLPAPGYTSAMCATIMTCCWSMSAAAMWSACSATSTGKRGSPPPAGPSEQSGGPLHIGEAGLG